MLIIVSVDHENLTKHERIRALKRKMRVLSFLLIINLIHSIRCDDDIKFESLALKIRPNVDEKTQQREAMNVIRRLISEKADNVAIKVNFKLPLNYFKVKWKINLHFNE